MTRTPFRFGLVSAALVAASVGTLSADDAHAFDMTKLSLRGGLGYVSGDPGAIQAGIGVGYFVISGLELGVTVDGRWPIGENSDAVGNLYIAGPYATYHLGLIPIITPYAGVFYRRWIYSGYPEGIDFTGFENSVGFRLGIGYTAAPLVRIFGGVVYERFLGCDDPLEAGFCDDWYPEIGVRISF